MARRAARRPGARWLDACRARRGSGAHLAGRGWGRETDLLASMRERDELLDTARRRRADIVLWFEPDLVCALALAQVADRLAGHSAPVWLVSVPHRADRNLYTAWRRRRRFDPRRTPSPPYAPRTAAVGGCARIQPAARRAARRAERRVAARARDPRRVAVRSAVCKRVVRSRLGQGATAMDQRPAAVGGRRRSGAAGEPVGRREIRHHVRRCRRAHRPLHATGDRPLAGWRAPRPGRPDWRWDPRRERAVLAG